MARNFDALGTMERRFVAGLPPISLAAAKLDAKARRDAIARKLTRKGVPFSISDDDAAGRYTINQKENCK